jgi:hypothetical protein
MELAALSPAIELVVVNALKSKFAGLTFTHDGDGIGLAVPVGGTAALRLTGLRLDAAGMSGRLHIDIDPAAPLAVEVFGGFKLGLTAFDLTVQDGCFSSTRIEGELELPFFTTRGNDGQQHPVRISVELGVRNDGLTLAVAAVQRDPARRGPGGLIQLDLAILGGKLSLALDQLEISGSDGNFKLGLGGALTLTTAGFQWPKVNFKGLSVDTRGHVELAGGWIDLPSHTALDFYGARLALHKLGFGRDTEGHRYIGFNGELQLIEGLPLGGSVRGMRIDLDSGDVEFAGVDLAFAIPGVLAFSGSINHYTLRKEQDAVEQGLSPRMYPGGASGKTFDVFLGGVRVELPALAGMALDAKLIVGTYDGRRVFFLAFDVGLPPPGIVLFPGVSLFGIGGLFATNLRPDPRPDHTFWDWYERRSIGTPNDNDYSLTNPNKWLPYYQDGALAIGAGVSLGTSDGYTVTAQMALVLMFPGPVIMLVGKARLLSARSTDPTSYGPAFEAMAVYDGAADSFDMAVHASYEIPYLLDMGGTAAVHAGRDSWYVALGQPPRALRMHARVFDIFETNAYLVINDTGLLFGTYYGYDKSFQFGPLGVGINVFMATIGAVQWDPLHFGGGIEVHGEAFLSAFGVHVSVLVDATLVASAPHPYWIRGTLDVALELPWPLPDLSASVVLEWGPIGDPPPLPAARARVDATLQDHGVSDRVALAAASDLPAASPVTIPQDAHFAVRFPRSMRDATGGALVGAYPVITAAKIKQDPRPRRGRRPLAPQPRPEDRVGVPPHARRGQPPPAQPRLRRVDDDRRQPRRERRRPAARRLGAAREPA